MQEKDALLIWRGEPIEKPRRNRAAVMFDREKNLVFRNVLFSHAKARKDVVDHRIGDTLAIQFQERIRRLV